MRTFRWGARFLAGSVGDRLLAVAASVPLVLGGIGIAAAEEPLSGLLLQTTSWSDDVALASADSSLPSEQSLADRVAALEQAVRAGGVSTAAAQEPMPAVAAAAAESCKPVDLILKPTYKWRGRLYVDMINYDDDNETVDFFDTDRDDSFGFGTARLGVQGDIYENISYVFELGFEGTQTKFKDVYAQMNDMPGVGSFRAGHFKEPIGLEELTSSRFITFMERSYATRAFTPCATSA